MPAAIGFLHHACQTTDTATELVPSAQATVCLVSSPLSKNQPSLTGCITILVLPTAFLPVCSEQLATCKPDHVVKAGMAQQKTGQQLC